MARRVVAAALGRAAFRDPGLVDDAVQECFVRLAGGLAGYRGEGSVAAYVAGVARRAALDELRRAARRFAKLERAAALEPPAPAEDPAAEAEGRIEAGRLLELLAEIEEPDRSLLYLREAEGFGTGELAAMFALPEGTVKSKVFRAKARLRGMMEARGGFGWIRED